MVEKKIDRVEKKEAKVEKTEDKVEKKSAKPSWIKMKPAEVEKIIIELAKQGETPAKIGLILRDKYGIPRMKVFGKKIVQILEENGVDYRSEKVLVDADLARLKKHISGNKHDYPASRSLTKKLWALYHLEKKN